MARITELSSEVETKELVMVALHGLAIASAIRAGTGRGVLPCYVGEGHPLLERLTHRSAKSPPNTGSLVHRDLRRAACVRALIDWMKALFAEQRDVLAGID
jgi:DNA-binding transcriptional LysR family regulator